MLTLYYMMQTREKQEEVELKPVRMSRPIRKGLADAWDRLGLVVASSALWAVSAFGPLALGWELQKRSPASWPWILLIGIAVGALLGTPVMAGVFRMAHNVVYRDDPSLSDIVSGARELFKAAWGFVLVNVLVIGVLLTDAAFFFGMFGPLQGSKTLYIIGALFLYLTLGWLMSAVYQMPTLAAQKPFDQKPGTAAAIKKSLILTMHNFIFTMGIFTVILGFTTLSVVSAVGMIVLWMGTVSILLTHALRELFVRYGVVEELSETIEDQSWEQ